MQHVTQWMRWPFLLAIPGILFTNFITNDAKSHQGDPLQWDVLHKLEVQEDQPHNCPHVSVRHETTRTGVLWSAQEAGSHQCTHTRGSHQRQPAISIPGSGSNPIIANNSVTRDCTWQTSWKQRGEQRSSVYPTPTHSSHGYHMQTLLWSSMNNIINMHCYHTPT